VTSGPSTGVGVPKTLVGDLCEFHKYHRPPVHETVVHHEWPRGMGGPDTAENKRKICPTGHNNIHRCIRKLCDGDPIVVGRDGTRKEIASASRGYDAWVKAGKPGRPE